MVQSGSRYLGLAGRFHHELISTTLGASDVIGKDDWWIACTWCQERIAGAWNFESHHASGRCIRCGRSVSKEAGLDEMTASGCPVMIPKVGADVALELAWAPGTLNGSYGGSLGHLYNTRTRLQQHVQLSPELVWDPVGLVRLKNDALPSGAGADLLTRGKAPLVMYYLLFDDEQMTAGLQSGSHPGIHGNQEPLAVLNV
jgi:hypothetical protein